MCLLLLAAPVELGHESDPIGAVTVRLDAPAPERLPGDVARIAEAVGLGEDAAWRAIEGLERTPRLLRVSPAGVMLTTELGAAALVRILLGGDPSVSRSRRLFSTLSGWGAGQRLNACSRAWSWLGQSEPAARWARALREEAASQRAWPVISTVDRAISLASLGPLARDECLLLARDVRRRLCADPDLAVGEASVVGEDDVQAAARRTAPRRLVQLFTACVRGRSDVPEVLDVVEGFAHRVESLAVAEELGKALADPLRLDDAVEGLLQEIGLRAPNAMTQGIAKAAAVGLLRAGVDWWAPFSGGVVHGSDSWNETDTLRSRRERMVKLAERWIAEGELSPAQAGWKILGHLWERPLGPGVATPMPQDVLALCERGVALATRVLTEPSDWLRWVPAEVFVLRVMVQLNPPREAVAAALRSFSREPLYLAWRLVAAIDNLIAAPDRLAEEIEGGAGWGSVCDAMVEFHEPPGFVGQIADALVDLELGPAELADWLRRVIGPRASERGWGRTDVLTEWMRRDGDLFREVLFGAGWDVVPPEARAIVLGAALPVFRGELEGFADGAQSSEGAGCLAFLRAVASAPSEASRADIDAAGPTLVELLPDDRWLAFMVAAVANPSAAVREQVVWWSYLAVHRERRPTTGLEEFARVACTGAAWTAGRRALVHRYSHRRTALDPVIGEAVLDACPDAIGGLERDEERTSPFVLASMRAGLTRWVSAVWRTASHARSIGSHVLLTPDCEPELAARAIEAVCAEAERRGGWGGEEDRRFWRHFF